MRKTLTIALMGCAVAASVAAADVGSPGNVDAVLFNFDENGNGTISVNGGPLTAIHGTLLPDPTQGGKPVLTYLLGGITGLITAGDGRVWEDQIGGTLSDMIRFTDANGTLIGAVADRMIYYSDASEAAIDGLADTGFPTTFSINAIDVLETGPEGNNGFQFAVSDNTYNGISDAPVSTPDGGSTVLLLMIAMLGCVGVRRSAKA